MLAAMGPSLRMLIVVPALCGSVAGCGRPSHDANISPVETYEQLDPYVGQQVLFCAKALAEPASSATNGKVVIAIDGMGRLKPGTVYYFHGTLKKLESAAPSDGVERAAKPCYRLETD